jgi:hypothetical protein
MDFSSKQAFIYPGYMTIITVISTELKGGK